MATTETVRPLKNAVLVRLEKPERLTASKLLFIPDTARREEYELYQATVLATGPGEVRKKDGAVLPMEVQVGDRVLIYWHGVEHAHQREGDEVWVSERSIQCVLEE